MFLIHENNEKISGACRSFVLCLDYVAISPFIYFKAALQLIRDFILSAFTLGMPPPHIKTSHKSTVVLACNPERPLATQKDCNTLGFL